jgi:NADPH:quinone reductase-like Zn-dependent oxidoreductase
MGTTMVGAFAEEVVVAPRSLSPIPAGVSDESAAAFGVAHRTAYHALRTIAAARPASGWWCSARAAASGWPPCSWARCWAWT